MIYTTIADRCLESRLNEKVAYIWELAASGESAVDNDVKT